MTQGLNQRTALLSQVDAVLFDLDGTLLDTAPDLVAALLTVCDEQSQQAPDPSLASRYVSTGAIGLVRLAFPNAPENVTERLRQRLVELYAAKLCVQTIAYPGIAEVLEHLEQNGLRWGIVTNKVMQLTEPLLQQLSLRARCSTVISGDSTAYRKPHPAPLQLGLQQLNVAAERAIYVGDAPQDIAAGRAAGVITVAASWGYVLPDQCPTDWQADYTIDQPLQLLDITR